MPTKDRFQERVQIQDEHVKIVAEEFYVACLDLLGFQAAIGNGNTTEIARMYCQIIDEVKSVKTGEIIAHGQSAVNAFPHIAQFTVFSDSFFIFAKKNLQDKDSDAAALSSIINLSNAIFQLLLAWEFAMVGGISHGPCVLLPEKNVYVGTGIVKAYKLQNEVDIVGVVCDPELVNNAVCSEPLKVVPRKKAQLITNSQEDFRLVKAPLPLAGALAKFWEAGSEPNLVELYRTLHNRAPGSTKSKYVNGQQVVETLLGKKITLEHSQGPRVD